MNNKIPTEYPYDDFPKLPPDGEIRKYPLVPIEWKFMCEDLGREIVKLKEKIRRMEFELGELLEAKRKGDDDE